MTALWKDPFTNPPAAQVVVWLKRNLVNTNPFTGFLDMSVAMSYVCGALNWPIPTDMLWEWKPFPTGTPPPGNPPISPSGWRDVLYYPPTDGQTCWVRRSPEDTSVAQAVWSLANLHFAVISQPFVIPWYSVVAWKPLSS
jgi:hypothetical protein